jgi:hypothetical protein
MTSAPSRRPVVFHGTPFEGAWQIAERGFLERRLNGDGEVLVGDGNLGLGIYVTMDPAIARSYGDTVLEVELLRGTRLIDVTGPPDTKLVKTLVREFGSGILSEHIHKVIPHNKQLTLAEAVAILKWHHQQVEREYDKNKGVTERLAFHARYIHYLGAVLRRHGIHGFGLSRDGVGMVVFAGDRLRAIGVLHSTYKMRSVSIPSMTATPDELRAHFERHASSDGRKLDDFLRSRHQREP